MYYVLPLNARLFIQGVDMKILSVLSLGILVLSGCKSTPERYLTQDPITIGQSEFQNYWVPETNKFNFNSSLLKRPKVSGFVKVKYLVDSNGEVFNPTIVESLPAGAWDKFALKALTNVHYVPAKTNSSYKPVYITTKFAFEA